MSHKIIAQIFNTHSAYLPTKCAAHLRPAGSPKPAFAIVPGVQTVIDACNYRSLSNPVGGTYSTISLDGGYTGIGCMTSGFATTSVQSDAHSVSISYTVQSLMDGKYYLYARLLPILSGSTVNVYIDNHLITTLSVVSGGWNWNAAAFVMPDTHIHTITFKFLQSGIAFDKFYISNVAESPAGVGPNYTTAPYVTVHAKLSSTANGLPIGGLNQSYAINTYDDIRREGWYNFDLTQQSTPTLTDRYAIQIISVGSSFEHYVTWDTSDKVTNPVAYSEDGSTWIADAATSMSIRVYADLNTRGDCYINTPEATLQTNSVSDFFLTEIKPRHNNTVVAPSELGNEVELDVSEKILTLVIDQSGSETWNDSTGLRHEFASEVVNAIQNRYPSDVRFNILKVNGQPAFSFFLPLATQVKSNSVADIIKESFKGKPENFAGFRVLRNPDRYPMTPIDGEIVFDGYALAALDTGLDQNQQYYYTVYTYDHFDRFSHGVKVPVKTNVITAPRGIPTFRATVVSGYDTPRSANIVAMWNMDEGDGSFAYDFSDSELTLSLLNTRWLAEYDCPTGVGGLRINGYNSTISSQPTNLLNFSNTSHFSVMGWVYPFATNNDSCILSRSQSGKFNWALIQDGLRIKLRIGSTVASCSTFLGEEEWAHVAVTYDGANVKFYINGLLKNTAAISPAAPNVSQMQINVGIDPSGTVTKRYFGKISHLHVHNIARDSSYVLEASTPKVRYTALGNPPGKIPPDNGDRLVIASFDVPEDFNYNLIRIVRNHVRVPYYESDGDIVLEVLPSAGKHSYGLSYDYDIDSTYWFRIFTKNSVGNWCPIEDSVSQELHISDQDRPHVVVSCGPGCTVEINPGPGFGFCAAPIVTAKAGNQKFYIKYSVPVDPECSLVKIYYRTDKYVTFDGYTKWVVAADSSQGANETPIFVGPASIGEFVHRGVDNLSVGFYTIVITDHLGRHSALVNVPTAVPLATADDSGIPLLEAINVSYHIDDYDIIRITWDSPVVVSSENTGWFDDKFYFYGAICDLYGNPLPIDYPDDIKIVSSVLEAQQSSVEDVFNTFAGVDTPERIPKATFSVNTGGLITGLIRLRSSPIFSVLKSITIGVSAEYTYSSTFKWKFPTSKATFNTPLEMKLVNRDSSYLPTGDFTDPACENGYESGGSDIPKSAYRFRVNGAYIRRKHPFVARAIFTFKGLPLKQATVTARIFDADGGPCEITPASLQSASSVLAFSTNAFELKTTDIPVLDLNGNDTGITELSSYADIPMVIPLLPQAARLYARVSSSAFQSVARMNIFYPTILKIALSATSPIGNGVDVREQFARAWFIDPDYPTDESKIQIVPDLSVIKWTISDGPGGVRKIPFYSTDNVPLANGVYSYTRAGTARSVFFGPAKSGSEGIYRITSSISISGLIASKHGDVEIKIPGSNDFTNYIPDPTAPRIFCEMDQCINYIWADGSDWVKMRIFRNPGDPTKTIVPLGGSVQSKYAPTFRSCSVDIHGHPTLFPLPIGTIVTVNAKGYEIVWGAVEEIIDNVTGVKKLNTDAAFNANDTADISLGKDAYYNVYFRRDAQIKGVGCQDVGSSNCCGFDIASSICDDPNEIGDSTGVVVSTKINLAGKPVVITGGGPIGDDNVARPPCVLVPREPLSLKLVGIFVNNKAVGEVVVDGKTMNKFVYQVKYSGRAMTEGTPLDVLLKINLEGDDVTKVGDFDIYTYFGVPKTVYTYTTTDYPGIDDTANTTVYSFASFTMNPIPIDKNVAIGIGVTSTFGKAMTEAL